MDLRLPVVLHELLRPFNFSYSVVLELVEALDGLSGKQFDSPSHTLVKDRDQLVITPRNLSRFGSVTITEGQTEVNEEHVQLTLRYVPADQYKLNTKPHVAALDAGLLKFPLKLRPWQEGDWFVPLGMNGKKKISDLLIDQKVPLNLKSKVLVLRSAQSIAWVVGLRPDNRFKVTDKTEEVLEIWFEGKS